MSNPYVQTECEKVLGANPTTKDYALCAAWILAHFKGINLKIYDMENTSSLCDFNIVASVENSRQASSMTDELLYNLKKAGLSMISLEGSRESDWILLDLGDIIVHLFDDISRDVYDLDNLWREQKQVEIPQEFYFGSHQETVAATSDSTNNYF